MVNGKNAVITGANRGIGRAMVEKFASEGYNIWACARKSSKEFEEDMFSVSEKYNVWIKPIYFELDSSDSIKAGYMQIRKDKLSVDVLINNAGVCHAEIFQRTSISTIKDIFAVNTFAVMEFTQYILKNMMLQKSGSIINMASIAGIDADPTNCAYGTSKAAVISFTKILASEVAPSGIRVNAIAPGPTDTDMVSVVKEKVGDAILSHSSMKRFAKPEEIADIALFLASESSSFVTGQVIRADGGGR